MIRGRVSTAKLPAEATLEKRKMSVAGWGAMNWGNDLVFPKTLRKLTVYTMTLDMCINWNRQVLEQRNDVICARYHIPYNPTYNNSSEEKRGVYYVRTFFSCIGTCNFSCSGENFFTFQNFNEIEFWSIKTQG